MNTIAVIHARGGSKRVPMKNIKLLAGKPLIAYMIEACLSAKLVDRVIVSTDHQDIIDISKQYGAEVPFVRPADLSEDVPTVLVTQHAVKFLEEKEGYVSDIVITIQPTTPFCLPEDVDGCVQTLIDHADADSAVSAAPILERPEWMFKIKEDGFAQTFLNNNVNGEAGVCQTLPELYFPNGGIYATRKEVLFEKNSVYGDKTKLWVMPFERSVDIDEPIDFEFAQFLAERKMHAK